MKKPFRFVFMAIATMLGGYLLITHVTETGISQEKEKNSKKRLHVSRAASSCKSVDASSVDRTHFPHVKTDDFRISASGPDRIRQVLLMDQIGADCMSP